MEEPLHRDSLESLSLLEDVEAKLDALQSQLDAKHCCPYPALRELVIRTQSDETLARALDLLFPDGRIGRLCVMDLDAYEVVWVMDKMGVPFVIDQLDLDILSTDDMSELLDVEEFLAHSVNRARVRVRVPAMDVMGFINPVGDDIENVLLSGVAWGFRIPVKGMEADWETERLWRLKELLYPTDSEEWVDVAIDPFAVADVLEELDCVAASLLLDQVLRTQRLVLKEVPSWFDKWLASRPEFEAQTTISGATLLCRDITKETWQPHSYVDWSS